jgi:hypothetical protein
MRVERIKEAKGEAVRFIRQVNRLMESLNLEDRLYGSKLSGALRRSSLDLTRALAEMRRP